MSSCPYLVHEDRNCQYETVNEKQQQIVEAAIRVFSRYGVRKTTMNDIAQEAGVVRQTLYNTFASKDEVLHGTIRHHVAQAVAAVRADWDRATTLGQRFDLIFEHTIVKAFDAIRAMPEAGDVIDGFNAASKQEAAVAAEQYRQLYREALATHETTLAKRGLDAHRLADFAGGAAAGFKHDAVDKDQLLALLATLKTALLALAEAD